MTLTLADRCKIKKTLNARLKSDGYWAQYNTLRAHLKASGVEEGLAWRVAAYPFPPKNGLVAEIILDPMYAEIAANWQNGKYTTPDDSSAGSNSSERAASPQSPGPDAWHAQWAKLAASARGREAADLDVHRWAFENYLLDAADINPDDVPSAGAVGLLMHLQASPSNYGDWIRSVGTKLLPDKKSQEYESRFKDDGRSLKLLDDFMASLEAEERERAEKDSVALHEEIGAALAGVGISQDRWETARQLVGIPPVCAFANGPESLAKNWKWASELTRHLGERGMNAIGKIWPEEYVPCKATYRGPKADCDDEFTSNEHI